MSSKAEIATTASYVTASGGLAVGTWMVDHWLQLLSALVVLATYFTQLYFSLRKDRREERQSGNSDV